MLHRLHEPRPRSMEFNSEMGAMIESADFGEQLASADRAQHAAGKQLEGRDRIRMAAALGGRRPAFSPTSRR
ncbi:MAG: hypothetical protein MZU95_10960 [Desulfomicrobium escambiense]|nr:hypothetical protein [Desulfomicrobium escambiense]